jgi:hypothetical protein
VARMTVRFRHPEGHNYEEYTEQVKALLTSKPHKHKRRGYKTPVVTDKVSVAAMLPEVSSCILGRVSWYSA